MSIATTPIETPKSPKSTEPQVRKKKKSVQYAQIVEKKDKM